MAAISSGVVSHPDARRILVVCSTAAIPETAHNLMDSPVLQVAAPLFERVTDFNELIFPLRPADFQPRTSDAHVWERLMRSWLGIDQHARVSLFVESLQGQPAQAFTTIFYDAPIYVHADGLMVYGPSRNVFPAHIVQRVRCVVFPDFVPSLQPLLLRESNPEYVRVDHRFLRDAIAQVADSSDREQCVWPGGGAAFSLVLGQYLADLGVLSAEEETRFMCELLVRAASEVAGPVVFRPHPSAPPQSMRALTQFARDNDIDVIVDVSPVPAEVLMHMYAPKAVFSLFSTGLASARYWYGIPAYAHATELLLERLSPFSNSNRIPVTLCDALFSSSTQFNDVAELCTLVRAVSYAMQPRINADLVTDAQVFISTHTDMQPHITGLPMQPLWRRYIKRLPAEKAGLIPPPATPQPARLFTPIHKQVRRACAPFLKLRINARTTAAKDQP